MASFLKIPFFSPMFQNTSKPQVNCKKHVNPVYRDNQCYLLNPSVVIIIWLIDVYPHMGYKVLNWHLIPSCAALFRTDSHNQRDNWQLLDLNANSLTGLISYHLPCRSLVSFRRAFESPQEPRSRCNCYPYTS